MAETLNMMEASIAEINAFIKDMFTMEIYDPVIVLGKMGMGKTASLKSLAKELGIGYCELRLVNMTETDMLGIPTVSAQGTTTYASNDLLPIVERDGERGILALDEITSCSSTMRAAAYQLLDGQRALGNYKLPDKWICVGLGNGPDDGGVFNGAEAALFTRCYGFRVSPSVEAWQQYALEADVHPSIRAYLNFDKSKLHVYDPDEMEGLCPTPRTWDKLSKLMKGKEKVTRSQLSVNTVAFLAAASIGVRESGSFAGFYQYSLSDKMINPEDILKGRVKNTDAKSIEGEVMYTIISKLTSELSLAVKQSKNPREDKAVFDMTVNACKWLIDIGNQRADYGIAGIRDIVSSVSELSDIIVDSKFDEACPELLRFAAEKNLMLG